MNAPDRARAVYLDHMTRLEGVTQEVVANGYISERMGDGLVSQGVESERGVTETPSAVPAGTRVSSRAVRKKRSRTAMKDGRSSSLKKPRLVPVCYHSYIYYVHEIGSSKISPSHSC